MAVATHGEERPAPRPRSVLGLVFLTAFLDLAGFSILFPLFPDVLRHYFALEGEASAIGRLVGFLRQFAGDSENAEFLVQTLFGGILGSLYSILQFLFTPVWGSVSDRIGRRPTLLVTLFGTLAAYGLWIFAGSFELLVLSRLIGGIMAGNLATVSAIVSDVTTERERTQGMGVVGAAIGLGFIFGPAIGGGAARLDLAEQLPQWTGAGINPFSAPALAAFVLAAVNLVWAAWKLPETLPPERRGARPQSRTINPLAMFSARAHGRDLARVNWVYFAAFLAFAAAEFTLVFLAVERFHFSHGQNAAMFVYVGLWIAGIQGGALRALAPRFGDRKLALAGHVLIAPGFLLVGIAGNALTLYAGLTAMAVGSALVVPALSALASRFAPPGRQGFALGAFRSVGSLSRALGPILGCVLYWRFGSSVPYLAAAAFLVLPFLVLHTVREPVRADSEPSTPR